MWEEFIRLSEQLEAEADTHEDLEIQKSLYGRAGSSLEAALPEITDDEVRGNQAVRAVQLIQRSGQQRRAIELARYWLGKNSLPQANLDDLKSLIIVSTNDITVREAKRRRISPNTEFMTPNSTSDGLVSPTNLGLFSNVEADILDLPVPNFQKTCVQALQASILLDIEHDPPQPSSPSEIADEFGVAIRIQRQLGICLTKNEAFDFLERLGVRPQKSSFNRQLTKGTYERFFNRDISSDGGKPYVFTYAEILHFEGIEPLLELPIALQNLLSY